MGKRSERVKPWAGVYSNSYDASLNVKNGFPVFSTVIEANSVSKQKDQFAAFKLTDEDRQEIHRLARDPRIGIAAARDSTPKPPSTAFSVIFSRNAAQQFRILHTWQDRLTRTICIRSMEHICE